MSFEVILIIIIVLAIGGGVGYVQYKKMQQLANDGKIVARKGAYWEEESLFTTSTTYEDLLNAVGTADFSDCSADVHPNFNGQASILFKSGHAWNAEIDYLGEQEGKNLFRFSFVAWETRSGMPYNINSMNMMLTTVEKLFFSLDPATTVQTRRAQIKSKTKFF